jgi:hypothetical protein
MRTISVKILALLLIGLLLGGAGCVLEDKVIELVVTGQTCADFEENEDSANWNHPVPVNYAEQIDEILADNGLNRTDINLAKVKKATYTVLDFSHTHDWNVSGTITVERVDKPQGPFALVNYTDQSLEAALGVDIPAELNEDGVDLLNEALQDYIDGMQHAFPELIFEVVNDGVSPEPTFQDPIVFDWEACIHIQVVVDEEVTLPDWP